MMDRQLALALFTGLAMTTTAGWAAPQPTQLAGRAVIGVNETVNPDIVGGVNFAFSDYTYVHLPTGGEWIGIHGQHLPYPDDGEEWENSKRLMDYAGFQYVRLEVGVTQWEPVNDNGHPHSLNLQSAFAFSPGFAAACPEVDANDRIHMDLMYRLLDHWEQRGLAVVLKS